LGRQMIIFICCFAITLSLGYLYFQSSTPKQTASPEQKESKSADTTTKPASENTDKTETTTATAGEGRIFIQRGCVQCHSVKALNIQGGAVGPDLSKAYAEVQSKHGISIQDFLKKPNSAVMSGVLGDKPLTDEEYNAVLAGLKAASEKP
jgi:mono/diheme cytochrome c family protein